MQQTPRHRPRLTSHCRRGGCPPRWPKLSSQRAAPSARNHAFVSPAFRPQHQFHPLKLSPQFRRLARPLRSQRARSTPRNLAFASCAFRPQSPPPRRGPPDDRRTSGQFFFGEGAKRRASAGAPPDPPPVGDERRRQAGRREDAKRPPASHGKSVHARAIVRERDCIARRTERDRHARDVIDVGVGSGAPGEHDLAARRDDERAAWRGRVVDDLRRPRARTLREECVGRTHRPRRAHHRSVARRGAIRCTRGTGE
jgi:hypothetical protein